MRLFLSLLLLFASAIGLALAARYNVGNVVLFYPPYRVDVSLNFFLLATALLFILLYVALRTLRHVQRLPGRVIAYRRGKREREGEKSLRDALKALFEGRFGHAEKAATRAAVSPANAGLASLIAARAAHRMQQPERRDTWLATVSDDSPLKMARTMTRLELLVDAHQPQAALEAFEELSAGGTRHIQALRLALKANQQSGNWAEVLRLVRMLDKHDALHPALSNRLRELAYDALLSDATLDDEALRRLWAGIPNADRVKPSIAVCAALAFNRRGLHDEACTLVEKALAAQWDERLVRAYRACVAPAASPALLAQIERCEQWLTQRPNDAELELTLGFLCLRQRLWGKAQRHLEQALSAATETDTRREAHLRLGQLHEALAQADEAASHYRQSALAASA
ncbi:MAG: heme biosynthesis protein HemY [Burkholderiaceae bacterium]